MQNKSFIENSELYLRSMIEGDLPEWTSWFNNPKTTSYMNKGFSPVTIEDQEKRLEVLNNDKKNIQLAIILKDKDILIGILGLHKIDWIHRHADISIVLGNNKYKGKGYGSQAISMIVEHAFNKLNMHKLTSGMWSNNHASEKIFISNGFIKEGCKKEQFFYQDAYVDELNYGLLKDDWKKNEN
jgi:[ribosomal protein S5]-alanine N-acetyltransferase